MESTPWEVEPDVTCLHGNYINVVVRTVVYQPGKHLCATNIKGQQVMTNCILQRGQTFHTILQGKVQYQEGHWWITMDEATRTFPRADPEMTGLYRIVDACAGLGAVATGYQACEAEIICHVEANPTFHQWAKTRTSVPCILGDITDHRTIAEVAKYTQGSHILSAGVSCQPFSRLGDGRQGADPRSASFPGALLMGYFLGSLAFLLECTQEAKDSEWIQGQLASFAQQLGYQVQQTVLLLHETWPSRRTRWWATIVHSALPSQQIPRMPAMRFAPTIIHVLRTMLNLSAEQLEQLQLSKYELRQFYAAKGGVGPKIIDMYKAMPTATHSWGSQVIACLCQCRSQGFSSERLEAKGLHAVLIPLPHVEAWGNQSCQAMRHPHPQEVAFLNALDPMHVKPTTEAPLRLELAGVWQLASPLQGAWVLANLTAQAKLLDSDMSPRHVLAQMCRRLLDTRDALWEVEGHTKPMKLFQQEVEGLDRPWTFSDPDDVQPDPMQPLTAREPSSEHPSREHPIRSKHLSVHPVEEHPLPKPVHPTMPTASMHPVSDHVSHDVGVGQVAASPSLANQSPEEHPLPKPVHPSTPTASMHPVHDHVSHDVGVAACPSLANQSPIPLAKPLPRLGCGGPAQDMMVTKNDTKNAEARSHAEHPSMPTESMHPVRDHVSHDVGVGQVAASPSLANLSPEEHPLPKPVHPSMPAARMHSVHDHVSHDVGVGQVAASPSLTNQSPEEHPLPKPVHSSTPTASMHPVRDHVSHDVGVGQVAACPSLANQSPIPRATPLPRLGCGGPAQDMMVTMNDTKSAEARSPAEHPSMPTESKHPVRDHVSHDVGVGHVAASPGLANQSPEEHPLSKPVHPSMPTTSMHPVSDHVSHDVGVGQVAASPSLANQAPEEHPLPKPVHPSKHASGP